MPEYASNYPNSLSYPVASDPVNVHGDFKVLVDALLFTFDISDITDFALDSIFVNAVVTVVAVLVVVVVVCEL